MRTIAVTGAASGMGAATVATLREQGHRVIDVDIRDAEIIANLADQGGRRDAVNAIRAACEGMLDGLVCAAGVSGADAIGGDGDAAMEGYVLAVNYFGSARLLLDLRPDLARGDRAAAVAISSWSMFRPTPLAETVQACLDMDEARAVRLVVEDPRLPVTRAAYSTSKIAIAKLVRRLAPAADWAGHGITLNCIVPSTTETPMVADRLSTQEGRATILKAAPTPLGRFARAEEQAAVAAFLVGGAATYVSGNIMFVDGALDAMRRPDDPIQALPDERWIG